MVGCKHNSSIFSLAVLHGVDETFPKWRVLLCMRMGVWYGLHCDRPLSQVVANTLGLNDSAYQYVIDALEADRIREEREKRDAEDRQQVRRIELDMSWLHICFVLLQ